MSISNNTSKLQTLLDKVNALPEAGAAESILYIPQTLTEAQQVQARTNISAAKSTIVQVSNTEPTDAETEIWINTSEDWNDNIHTAEGAVLYTAQTLTESQKAQARANIGAAEDSALELVDSIDECIDTSKRYVLPDGYIYAYTYGEHIIESKNHILSSINSDGTPYNGGLGYKTGYRLNSSGVEASENLNGANNMAVVSGFIPYNGESIELRVPTTVPYGGGNSYLHVYDSNFVVIKKDTTGAAIDGSYRALNHWASLYGATYVTEDTTLKFSFPAESLAIDGIAYIRVSSQVHTNSTLSNATFDLALGESLDYTEVVTDYSWQNTGLYYGSADTGNRLDALESTASDHETRLTALESNSGNSNNSSNNISNDVPDYWVSELETKASAIQAAMEKAGRKKSAFLWYTDAHWPNGNSKMSPKLLKYFYENTPMNKVNFGGDIIGDTLLATRDDMEYLYEWRKSIKDLPNHHSVFGNHDNFNLDTVDYEDENYRYAFLLAPEETNDMVMGDGNYYYMDNHAEKTRYLYFDYIAANQTAMMAQGQFMVDAIKSVPEGWHIVAISHRWWQYSSSSTPLTGSIPAFEKDMLSVFDAYNARTTRSDSNYFYAQDFTEAKGKVEFCIGGHIHVDYDFESTGGIPVIITTSDTNQNRVPDSTVDSGTVGTTTEAAVFGIIADYTDADNTKINVIGVGRGTSRVVRKSTVKPTSISDITYSGDTTVGATIDKSKFSFTVNYNTGATDTINGATSVSPATIGVVGDNAVTITYIEGATTVSGTVTIVGTAVPVANLFDKNDADVADTGRFNSSNAAVAYQPGQLVTGYIAATVGDTFTVISDKSAKTNNYTGTGLTYKKDKSAIGQFAQSSSFWNRSADGLTSTITIPATNGSTDHSATAYIRFCVAYTDIDNIVITKA